MAPGAMLRKTQVCPSSIERFPYPVSTLDQLEPAVRTALRAHLQPEETIERLIVAPPKEMFGIPREWRQRLDVQPALSRIMSWVLALTEQRLLIVTVAGPNDAPAVLAVPIDRLLWVEVGIILLFGWFECAWAGHDRVQRTRVFFNTVGEELFQGLRVQLCRTLIEHSGQAGATGDRSLSKLDSLPFKFMSLLSMGVLLPDERIEALAFHPTLLKRRLVVLKQRRAPATALILSNYHLVVAHEDPSQHDATYGLITRYCPRRRVRAVTLEKHDVDLLLHFTVGLKEAEETFSVLFQADMEPALGEWLTTNFSSS